MAADRRKWHLAAALALALSAPVAAHAATDMSEAAVFYEDALKRHAAGDDRGAIIQLKNVIQRDPRHIAAHMLKGRIHLARREAADAIFELQKARELGADEALVLLPLGEAYLMQGRFDDVLSRFSPPPGSREASRDVYVLHGFAYLAKRDLKAAEAAFRRAAELVPSVATVQDAAPIRGLARVALQRHRPEEARALLEPLKGRAAADADYWFLLAEISRSQDRIDPAITELGEALSIDADLHQARLTRAALLILRDKDGAARKDIDYVRERLPDQPQAMYFDILLHLRAGDRAAATAVLEEANLLVSRIDKKILANDRSALFLAGFVNFARGNQNEAEAYLSRHLELEPGNVFTRKLLGRIYLTQGRPKDAIVVLEPALKTAHPDAEALSLLGDAYLKRGNYETATATLEKALALTPDQDSLVSQLALSRLAIGRIDEAATDLAKYVERNPDDLRAVTMLGLIHARTGEFAKARSVADTMIRHFPDNPIGYNLAGAADLNLGEPEHARQRFEHALAISPDFLPARLNLGRLEDHLGRRGQAREQYRLALEQRPNEPRAMMQMARLAEKDGSYDEAIEWVDKVVRKDRAAIPPLLELARLNLLAHKPDAALAAVRQAQGVAPSDRRVLEAVAKIYVARGELVQARQTLGVLSHESQRSAPWLQRTAALQVTTKDDEGAMASLKRALEVAPDDLSVHASWIQFLFYKRQFDAALAHAQKVRTAHPDAPMSDRLLGDALYKAGRFGEAAEVYRAGLQKRSSTRLILSRYAALAAAGRKDQGIADLEAWLASHPDSLPAKRVLATGYLAAGRTRESIALHEQLVRQLSEDAGVFNNLAVLYSRVGDGRALSVAARAYALDPTRVTVLDTYGWLLARNGDQERGLGLLREAFARDANSPDVRYHLAAILAERGRENEALDLLKGALSRTAEFEGRSDAVALLEKLERR